MKGGLVVLSIGTAPPRARWTEGMRYIVKPKNKISAEKRKKPSRPCSGASSHPLRTEVRLRNVRNLSRTKIKTEEKKRFVVLPKLESKPLDNISCVYANMTSRSQPNQNYLFSQQNQVTTKTNIRNVESNLKSSYNSSHQTSQI